MKTTFVRALALAAGLAAASPFAALAAPSVQFLVPVQGGALWGNVQGPPNCIVTGTDIARVMFYINDVWTNTDGDAANGLGCWLDTRKYADGAYTLKAVAYNAAGQTATATRPFVIRNAGAPSLSKMRPAMAFQVPDIGGALSGNVQGPPYCVMTGYNLARVMFYLNGVWTNTDGNGLNAFGCWIDTTKYADGEYTVTAVGYNVSGGSTTIQRSIRIANGLASMGARAVATFESLGLYWTPPSNPGSAGCTVRYRRSGTTAWLEALPMWYDARNAECRGSIVHLAPGTSYDVQLGLPGQAPAAQLTATTWSEAFPIARTVYVNSSSQQLNITEGGTASGYVLYTPAPGTQATIDVGNAADYNVRISAPYVIVRGLTLRGARIDGIRLAEGSRDVVLEDNDISGWGRYRATLQPGWDVGVDFDAGIRAVCGATPWLERVVIQRNRIHDPRYGANSWDYGHPLGPQGIMFESCGGNHVIRHNHIYSSDRHYFNDGMSGVENFSAVGFPNADSDIYGNLISHVWDDAIEAEGGNRNVRIWGNYTDQTAVSIATTVTHFGPVYVFRNVMNRSRQLVLRAPDEDEELGRAFAKSGTVNGFGGGRRYVFHNTLLQAPPPAGSIYESGAGIGLKGNGGQPMTNTVSRNNIYHIRKPWLSAIDERGAGSGNDVDYDLFNGNVVSYPGAERNGIVGTPIYEPGHGWSSESAGLYQLAPASPGYDRGVRLPNFNDAFSGAAPDMGAHEAGAPAMRFGVPAIQ